jgi:hypothetical protein
MPSLIEYTVNCPKCDAKFSITQEFALKKLQCNCGNIFTVESYDESMKRLSSIKRVLPFEKADKIVETISKCIAERSKVFEILDNPPRSMLPQLFKKNNIDIFEALLSMRLVFSNVVLISHRDKNKINDTQKYCDAVGNIEYNICSEFGLIERIFSSKNPEKPFEGMQTIYDPFMQYFPEFSTFVTFINSISKDDPTYWEKVYKKLNLIYTGIPVSNKPA